MFSSFMGRVPMAALMLTIGATVSADDAVQRAAKARTVQEALTALGVPTPELGRKVLLEVPDLVLKNRKAMIKVSSQIPGTDWIAVLVEPREAPFIEAKDFSPGVDHSFSVQVDFARTSTVRAVVRAGGKYFQVKREVKVVVEERGSNGR